MKVIIGLVLALLIAFPALAQDAAQTENASTECNVDVSGAQALLEQAAAASGADAVALIAQARGELQQIEQNCAAAGVVALDQTYTAPDDAFTLSYPDGWTTGTFTPSSTGGVILIGNSPLADRLLQVAEPEIVPGEQAVQVLVGAPQTTENVSLQLVIADFEDLIGSLYQHVTTTEYYALEGRAAARLTFQAANLDGVVIGVELGGGRYAVVRGVASSGSLNAIQSVVEGIAASIK
jgi:hypothetical protein